jgi:transposase-like protein
VEMMAERDVKVAHSTILRWVTRYVPEFEKRWERFAKAVGTSWRVDETYISIKGEVALFVSRRRQARYRGFPASPRPRNRGPIC